MVRSRTCCSASLMRYIQANRKYACVNASACIDFLPDQYIATADVCT